MPSYRRLAVLALAFGLGACSARVEYIPGTSVARTGDNQTIINRVEDYRMAVERKDTAALLMMASKKYWEDAGTSAGGDDYGFQGLSEVLSSRFQQAESIRYSMKYKGIKRNGNRAFVDVLVDASFSVRNARGVEVRADMRDQNQFILEWDGKQWLFLSGM
jgi:hypothetical protein